MRIDRIPRAYKLIDFFLIFLGLGFGTVTPALAQTLPPVVYSASTSEDIVVAYAAHYGTPAAPLLNTLKCESSLNPKAVGDHGTSFGVAQIHLPAHTDITKAEALDPLFAIDWAAKQFSEGHQNMWSCYTKLYGSDTS